MPDTLTFSHVSWKIMDFPKLTVLSVSLIMMDSHVDAGIELHKACREIINKHQFNMESIKCVRLQYRQGKIQGLVLCTCTFLLDHRIACKAISLKHSSRICYRYLIHVNLTVIKKM